MNQEKLADSQRKKLFSKRNIDLGIVVLSLLLAAYLGWTPVNSVIFGIFIWIILNPLSSRLLAYPALIFLSVTPFLLVLERKGQAEEFALYAFYFLAMSVVMGISELHNKKEAK